MILSTDKFVIKMLNKLRRTFDERVDIEVIFKLYPRKSKIELEYTIYLADAIGTFIRCADRAACIQSVNDVIQHEKDKNLNDKT